jgi:predicted RNase H-like nuclease
MSARTALRDALRTALPGYRVTGSAVVPSGISRPTVAVWQQSVVRRDELGQDRATVNLEIWVLVGHEDPEKADDALDAALDDLILALQPIDWVQWSEAQRGVLADTFPGYNITVTAVATIGTE